MYKSLSVFALSFTPVTPSFGTFGGVAHPPCKISYFLKKILFFNCVYVNISNLKYQNIFILKK